MEIIKTDNPDPIYYGGEIEYEIVVKNIGDGEATGVVLKDEIGEGLQYLSAIPSPDEINGSNMTWYLGTMQPGDVITIYLYAKAVAFGVLNNTAFVACDEGLYAEDNETTTVIEDNEPPYTKKVFHGEVQNVSIFGIYILHYIPKTTYITLKAVDYPLTGNSGVNHTYYRIWKWNNDTDKWELIFDWKEYFGEAIYLYDLRGYGKYEIEFYSIDRRGNVEEMEWNDVYVYEE